MTMPDRWKETSKSDLNTKSKKKNFGHIKLVLLAINKINLIIIKENDKKELVKKICNALVKTGGYFGALITLIDQSNNLIVASKAGFGKKFSNLFDKIKTGDFPNCFTRALRNPDIYVTNKKHDDCQICIFSEFSRKNLGLVIRIEHMGKIYGVLSITLLKDLILEQEEFELFKIIAKTIAIALNNIDLEEERRQAEKELRKVKKSSEQIFNTSIPMFVTNKNLRIIQVNDTFCSFFRKKREDIIGQRCINIWEDAPCMHSEKTLKLVLEKGKSHEFEFEKEFNDGKRIISIVKSVPYRNPDGEIIGLINSFVDITEHKKAEEKLKFSEREYKNIIENTKDGIIIVGFDGKIRFISHQISSMLGKDVVKLESSFFNYIHPDDRKFITKLFKEALRKKNSLEDNVIEFRALNENGNYIWLSSSTKNYYNKEGNITGFISLLRDVTQKKKAEEVIRESETRYRGLFENAPISIWEEDFSEVKKYLNHLKNTGVKDFRKFFNDNPNEVVKTATLIKVLDVNQNTLELFHAENKKDLISGLKNVFTKESYLILKEEILHLYEGFTSFSAEATNKTLTGKSLDIFLNLNIVPGYEDTWSKILVSIIDITERKKAEEALKESEGRYKDLFENSPDPIIIANMNGEIVDCNSATEIFFGKNKRNEILNNENGQFTSFVSKFVLALKENKIEKINEDFKFEQEELKIKKIDGNYAWVKIQPSIIKIGGNRFLYLIFQDLTKIKQSELDLVHLEQTLEELDALIENAPLAILLLKQNTKILRANEEAQLLLEYSQEELLNIDVIQLFEIECIKAVKKHYKNEISHLNSSNRIETKIITKNGKILEIEVTSTILRISDNIIIQSYFSDITERKNYEKNRQKLLDQLIASLEFKKKFLATMSHELRTPLNSLLGFSQLLLMESYGKINNKQKDFLEDIKTAGEDLLILIDSILDLSKIDAGKFKLNLQKVNLHYLIEQVKTTFRPIYIKKELGFLVEGIKSNNYIIVDPGHFKRILYNLLSNAIKFTERGIITLRGIERSDHWEFQVIDMGVGIAKQDYEVVFREFGRVEHDRIKKIPGTGLGLALTKHLVILHEGDIWFESELEQGTTFFFTIPKREDFNG